MNSGGKQRPEVRENVLKSGMAKALKVVQESWSSPARIYWNTKGYGLPEYLSNAQDQSKLANFKFPKWAMYQIL